MNEQQLATGKKVYSYQDYACLPDGVLYQLIGSDLIMIPTPSPLHQRIVKRVVVHLHSFVEEDEETLGEVFIAPLDVFFSDDEVFQPDVFFVARERADIVNDKKIKAAPDLVVEVLSPATAYYDLKHKKRVYAQFGVKEYWVVDPLESDIEVLENRDGVFMPVSGARGEGEACSALLPGFALDVAALFA